MNNYGDSIELSIPSKLLKILKFSLIDIKKSRNSYWRPHLRSPRGRDNSDSKNWPPLLFLWMNDDLNIEMTSMPNKIRKRKKFFLIGHPRVHGGSCVFTIPPPIIDVYEILKVRYDEFTIFENARGNVELEPIK